MNFNSIQRRYLTFIVSTDIFSTFLIERKKLSHWSWHDESVLQYFFAPHNEWIFQKKSQQTRSMIRPHSISHIYSRLLFWLVLTFWRNIQAEWRRREAKWRWCHYAIESLRHFLLGEKNFLAFEMVDLMAHAKRFLCDTSNKFGLL